MLRRAIIAALALALVLTSAPSHANASPVRPDPRDFQLVNASSITFVNLYVASSASKDWGDDILGQDVLAPGETTMVHFTRFDGTSCLYDIMVTGKGGESGELNQVDLCTVDTVTFR